MKYLFLVLFAFSLNGRYNRMINFERYSRTLQSSTAGLRWRSPCLWRAATRTLAGMTERMEAGNVTGSSRMQITREVPISVRDRIFCICRSCGVDLYETGMSWFTAMECCYFNKGYLAEPQNDEEQAKIVEYITAGGCTLVQCTTCTTYFVTLVIYILFHGEKTKQKNM